MREQGRYIGFINHTSHLILRRIDDNFFINIIRRVTNCWSGIKLLAKEMFHLPRLVTAEKFDYREYSGKRWLRARSAIGIKDSTLAKLEAGTGPVGLRPVLGIKSGLIGLPPETILICR